MNGRIRSLSIAVILFSVTMEAKGQKPIGPRRAPSQQKATQSRRQFSSDSAKARKPAKSTSRNPSMRKEGVHPLARRPARTNPQLVTRANLAPSWYPLDPKAQQRVDLILQHWEQNTSDIKTFRGKFRRYEYSPLVVTGKAAVVAEGTILYAKPDKGSMSDEKIYEFDPSGKKNYKLATVVNESGKVVPKPGQFWLCDGKSIFFKRHEQKLMSEQVLPPELQGKAISEGPLPFIFGAKASTMKRRFWIRELKPKDNPNGYYYLEVVPRTRDDAANYENVVVVLEKGKGTHFLPREMKVTLSYQIDASGKRRAARIDKYIFVDQRVNDQRDKVADFINRFVRPDIPRGWKREVRDWNGNLISSPVASRDASTPGKKR